MSVEITAKMIFEAEIAQAAAEVDTLIKKIDELSESEAALNGNVEKADKSTRALNTQATKLSKSVEDVTKKTSAATATTGHLDDQVIKITKDLKKMGDAADDAGKGGKGGGGLFGGALGDFGQLAAGIGIGGLLSQGISSLKNQLTSSAKEAASNELVWLRLQRSIEYTGVSATTSSIQFKAMADSLEQLTGVADELIGTSFNQMVRANIDVNTQYYFMKIALDAAALSGKNLANVIDLMMKASAGQEGSLERLAAEFGIAVTKGQSFQTIIEKIAATTAGDAASSLQGLQGDLSRISIALGNVKEDTIDFWSSLMRIGKAVAGFSDADQQFKMLFDAAAVPIQEFGKNLPAIQRFDALTSLVKVAVDRLADPDVSRGERSWLPKLIADVNEELKDVEINAAAAMANMYLFTAPDEATATRLEKFAADAQSALDKEILQQHDDLRSKLVIIDLDYNTKVREIAQKALDNRYFDEKVALKKLKELREASITKVKSDAAKKEADARAKVERETNTELERLTKIHYDALAADQTQYDVDRVKSNEQLAKDLKDIADMQYATEVQKNHAIEEARRASASRLIEIAIKEAEDTSKKNQTAADFMSQLGIDAMPASQEFIAKQDEIILGYDKMRNEAEKYYTDATISAADYAQALADIGKAEQKDLAEASNDAIIQVINDFGRAKNAATAFFDALNSNRVTLRSVMEMVSGILSLFPATKGAGGIFGAISSILPFDDPKNDSMLRREVARITRFSLEGAERGRREYGNQNASVSNSNSVNMGDTIIQVIGGSGEDVVKQIDKYMTTIFPQRVKDGSIKSTTTQTYRGR